MLCGLLLQSCRSSLCVIPEIPMLEKAHKTSDDVQVTGQALDRATDASHSGCSVEHIGVHDQLLPSESLTQPSVLLPSVPVAARSTLTTVQVPRSFSSAMGMPDTQPSYGYFITSSGERISFKKMGNEWQAALDHSTVLSCAHEQMLSVVSSGEIEVLLTHLQQRDVQASRSHIHIMVTEHPPHVPYVYLDERGLLGGVSSQRVSSEIREVWILGPSMKLDSHAAKTAVYHIPSGYRYKGYRLKAGSVIQCASLSVNYVDANNEEAISYLATVQDLHVSEETLEASLQQVAISEIVEGDIEGPSSVGHQGLHIDTDCEKSGGLVLYGQTTKHRMSTVDVQLEICLETDTSFKPCVAPSLAWQESSRAAIMPTPPCSRPVEVNRLLEQVLETRIRASYEKRLAVIAREHEVQLASQAALLRQKNEELDRLKQQYAISQASLLRYEASFFGAKEWERYFGEVGETPPLPSDIVEILDSPCPFWQGKQVKDTHLLVLIPAAVNDKPFTLNLLGELVQNPKQENRSTAYRYYNTDVQQELGHQSTDGSYWILMTRCILPNTSTMDYPTQKTWVAMHADRMQLPYTMPHALEAATAILSHYVCSGERLYTDDLCTWTRCQELILDSLYDEHGCIYEQVEHPVVVGGFSPVGLDVSSNFNLVYNYGSGAACLRRL
jgi:hypothetical protein